MNIPTSKKSPIKIRLHNKALVTNKHYPVTLQSKISIHFLMQNIFEFKIVNHY